MAIRGTEEGVAGGGNGCNENSNSYYVWYFHDKNVHVPHPRVTTGYSNTSYIVYYELFDPRDWCPVVEEEFNCSAEMPNSPGARMQIYR